MLIFTTNQLKNNYQYEFWNSFFCSNKDKKYSRENICDLKILENNIKNICSYCIFVILIL